MIRLINLQDKTLSRGIRSLSPMQYDTIQIKNRLLDGSYHVQMIGEPAKSFTFEILSNQDQVNKINIAESIGENLRLIIDDKAYIGLIDKALNWKRVILRYKDENSTYHTASIKFNIQSEGVV